jgi:hypothetical protein
MMHHNDAVVPQPGERGVGTEDNLAFQSLWLRPEAALG